MVQQNFDYALKQVLESEGGYSNDPQDPGGPTNFGITLHDYRAYINPSGTASDVKHMSVDQAAAIYKPKYWDAVKGDELPSGVDYCVFDYGVNSGVARANRVLHQVGPNIDAICDERLKFLKGLKTWPRFGKGWRTRVDKVRRISKQMAAIPETAPTPVAAASQPKKKESWFITLIKNWLPQRKQS